MGKGQPRGLLAARKLRNTRREGRWADLHYKKRLFGTAFKSSPFGVRTHHLEPFDVANERGSRMERMELELLGT